MKIKASILFASLLLIGFGVGQVLAQQQKIEFSASPMQKVTASSITWKSHFGGRKEEP